MANWTDIKTTKYSGAVGGYNVGLSVTLQYDAESITPTSVKLRFKGSKTSTNYGTDGYYVLVNPGNTSGNELMLLVKGINAAPTTTSSFKVTKTYTAAKFTVPTYWICHMGQVTPYESDNRWYATFYNDREDKKETHTVYKWFKTEDTWWYNSRMNYKTVVSSAATAIASNKSVATAVTVSAPTITDNGNNTYTITAPAGVAGTNNAVKSSTLYYRAGGSGDYTKASSLTAVTAKNLSVSNSTASQTIYAYTKVDGTYNDVTSSTTSKTVKNYVMPSYPGTPVLSESSKKNGRLTIKQNWTYTWTASTQANSSSPVKGYRIFLYRKAAGASGFTGMTGLVLDGTNGIKKGSNSKGHIDRATSSLTVTFNPVDLGFLPGDEVKLGLHSWTVNGAGTKLWSGSGDTQVYSAATPVEHAGIMRVNVSTNTKSNWKEGQVYVNIGTTKTNWKEADAVYVNVSTNTKSNWQESE